MSKFFILIFILIPIFQKSHIDARYKYFNTTCIIRVVILYDYAFIDSVMLHYRSSFSYSSCDVITYSLVGLSKRELSGELFSCRPLVSVTKVIGSPLGP